MSSSKVCIQISSANQITDSQALRSPPAHQGDLYCIHTIHHTSWPQLLVMTHSSKEHEGECANPKTELNAILKALSVSMAT